jgi:uncharacterized membrane protein
MSKGMMIGGIICIVLGSILIIIAFILTPLFFFDPFFPIFVFDPFSYATQVIISFFLVVVGILLIFIGIPFTAVGSIMRRRQRSRFLPRRRRRQSVMDMRQKDRVGVASSRHGGKQEFGGDAAICPWCGAHIHAGDVICSYCGGRI